MSNNNPERVIPPPGVYDIATQSWHARDSYFDVTFQIIRGRHIGFSFPERIYVALLPHTPERALYDGFLKLHFGSPTDFGTAHLIRRCVHGIKTLGLKKWGWR